MSLDRGKTFTGAYLGRGCLMLMVARKRNVGNIQGILLLVDNSITSFWNSKRLELLKIKRGKKKFIRGHALKIFQNFYFLLGKTLRIFLRLIHPTLS